MKDFLLVSLGAVLGVNTRFIIYQKLKKLHYRKDFIILIINIFSSFCLGILLSLLSKHSSLQFSYQLALFFSIGFLGSLSTFSTFVYDLFDLFLRNKFFQLFKLLFLSLALGLIAFGLGFLLVN